MSRFKYCMTCWSQAPYTTIKPLKSLYKRAAKILDKKERSFHHCEVYKTQGLLTLEHQIEHANLLFIHKILNGGAPPTLRVYVQLVADNMVRVTRGGLNLHCKLHKRSSTFGQTSFSYRGISSWNELPLHFKTIKSTKSFSEQLKNFLIEKQTCQCWWMLWVLCTFNLLLMDVVLCICPSLLIILISKAKDWSWY